MKYTHTIVIIAGLAAICSLQASSEKERLRNAWTQKLLKDQAYDEKVGNFFERSERQKQFEYLEHSKNFEDLAFLLTANNLDPKLHGVGIKQYAQAFVGEMRTVLEKEFKKDEVLGRNDIRRISKHAAQLSNACASLELDARGNRSMKSIKGKDSRSIWSTDIDGRTFYDSACSDLFKNLSDKRLAEIVEKTKN